MSNTQHHLEDIIIALLVRLRLRQGLEIVVMLGENAATPEPAYVRINNLRVV